MNRKELLKGESLIINESIDYKIGFYTGVLGGTNDPDIRNEADLKLRELLRIKNRGKVKI